MIDINGDKWKPMPLEASLTMQQRMLDFEENGRRKLDVHGKVRGIYQTALEHAPEFIPANNPEPADLNALKKEVCDKFSQAENLSGEKRAIIFAIDYLSARGVIITKDDSK